MVKFNELLNLRLKSKDTQPPKMTALAEKSSQGSLSSFSGVFKLSSLNDDEKEGLSKILQNYLEEEKEVDIKKDLEDLITITAEVKAITNQAVILHGERVKKAQTILKNYKEGAFTAWLMSTYGNRQTPYNFLQYYEFYMSMPSSLRPRIDSMPRQAVYSLASRSGDLNKKEDIIKNYQGQPKQEILTIIRRLFPLPDKDKRQSNISFFILSNLKKLSSLLASSSNTILEAEKNEILNVLQDIQNKLK